MFHAAEGFRQFIKFRNNYKKISDFPLVLLNTYLELALKVWLNLILCYSLPNFTKMNCVGKYNMKELLLIPNFNTF
jgi:hypothetical protein